MSGGVTGPSNSESLTGSNFAARRSLLEEKTNGLKADKKDRTDRSMMPSTLGKPEEIKPRKASENKFTWQVLREYVSAIWGLIKDLFKRLFGRGQT